MSNDKPTIAKELLQAHRLHQFFQNADEVVDHPLLEVFATTMEMNPQKFADLQFKNLVITQTVLENPITVTLDKGSEIYEVRLTHPRTGNPLLYKDIVTARSGPLFGGFNNPQGGNNLLSSNLTPEEIAIRNEIYENKIIEGIEKFREITNNEPSPRDIEFITYAASLFLQPHLVQRGLSDHDLTLSSLSLFEEALGNEIRSLLDTEHAQHLFDQSPTVLHQVAQTAWEKGGNINIGDIKDVLYVNHSYLEKAKERLVSPDNEAFRHMMQENFRTACTELKASPSLKEHLQVKSIGKYGGLDISIEGVQIVDQGDHLAFDYADKTYEEKGDVICDRESMFATLFSPDQFLSDCNRFIDQTLREMQKNKKGQAIQHILESTLNALDNENPHVEDWRNKYQQHFLDNINKLLSIQNEETFIHAATDCINRYDGMLKFLPDGSDHIFADTKVLQETIMTQWHDYQDYRRNITTLKKVHNLDIKTLEEINTTYSALLENIVQAPWNQREIDAALIHDLRNRIMHRQEILPNQLTHLERMEEFFYLEQAAHKDSQTQCFMHMVAEAKEALTLHQDEPYIAEKAKKSIKKFTKKVHGNISDILSFVEAVDVNNIRSNAIDDRTKLALQQVMITTELIAIPRWLDMQKDSEFALTTNPDGTTVVSQETRLNLDATHNFVDPHAFGDDITHRSYWNGIEGSARDRIGWGNINRPMSDDTGKTIAEDRVERFHTSMQPVWDCIARQGTFFLHVKEYIAAKEANLVANQHELEQREALVKQTGSEFQGTGSRHGSISSEASTPLVPHRRRSMIALDFLNPSTIVRSSPLNRQERIQAARARRNSIAAFSHSASSTPLEAITEAPSSENITLPLQVKVSTIPSVSSTTESASTTDEEEIPLTIIPQDPETHLENTHKQLAEDLRDFIRTECAELYSVIQDFGTDKEELFFENVLDQTIASIDFGVNRVASIAHEKATAKGKEEEKQSDAFSHIPLEEVKKMGEEIFDQRRNFFETYQSQSTEQDATGTATVKVSETDQRNNFAAMRDIFDQPHTSPSHPIAPASTTPSPINLPLEVVEDAIESAGQILSQSVESSSEERRGDEHDTAKKPETATDATKRLEGGPNWADKVKPAPVSQLGKEPYKGR